MMQTLFKITVDVERAGNSIGRILGSWEAAVGAGAGRRPGLNAILSEAGLEKYKEPTTPLFQRLESDWQSPRRC